MVIVFQNVRASLGNLMIGDCEEIRQIWGILGRFASFRRPGAWLIDVFPELEYIPLFDLISNWKAVGAEIHRQDREIFTAFWNKMKRKIAEGTAPHSWGKGFVQSD